MLHTTGSRLGPYEIVGAIGAGGMGEVYRARDPKLQRDVAIKLVTAAGSSPEALERFQREARAIAALNHPNIVTIYSVEEAEGRPFLAMEFVDGETLADTLSPRGLPLDRILEYAIPLADALGAAHAQGITHRDLKPSNVMITKDRRVKILDFGLAKLRGDDIGIDAAATTRGLTGQGQIVGTVAYMSPEQACGTPVDPRTDLFSFGVMLYEMATGRRPFAGDSAVAVIASILKEQPQPLAGLRPDLPREFSRIVRRALAKDPEQRYQTAKDLRNDLQTLKADLTSGELTTAAPASAGRPMRSMAPIAAGVVAVVAVGVGAYVLLRGRTSPPEAPPTETVALSRLTSSGKASVAAISPDGKYVVHVVSDNGSSLWIRQTATGSNVQILPPVPNRYASLTFSPDGNYVYFTREDGRATFSLYRIATLGGTPQPIVRDVDSAVAFSPDGSQLAFIRGQPSRGKSAIFVARGDGSNLGELISHDMHTGFQLYSGLAWSPDGRKLAVPLGGFGPFGVGDALVETIDVTSKAERPLTGRRWRAVLGLAWLPDGGIVISAADSGKPNFQLWRVAQDDGTVRRLTNDLNSYNGISAATTTASLVTVQGDQSSTLGVTSAETGGVLEPVTTGAGRYDGQLGLTWTASGKLVYTSAAGGQLDLWMSEADGSQARAITSTAAIEEAPAVCPDNNTVIFVETAADRRGLSRLNLGTGRVTALTNDPTDASPACLADGRTVIFARTIPAGPKPHRMSVDGTGITELSAAPMMFAPATPDGRFAIGIGAIHPGEPSVIAVLPLDGVGPLRGFNILNLPIMVEFSPRGDALTFLESRNGPPALWTQPLDGSAPKKLFDLHGEAVFGFAWSRDGRLVVAHGPAPTDVILMAGVR